jgi:hypothetical protein
MFSAVVGLFIGDLLPTVNKSDRLGAASEFKMETAKLVVGLQLVESAVASDPAKKQDFTEQGITKEMVEIPWLEWQQNARKKVNRSSGPHISASRDDGLWISNRHGCESHSRFFGGGEDGIGAGGRFCEGRPGLSREYSRE